MDTLSPSNLLSIWERGLAQPPVERALTMLAAALPEVPPDTLAQLTIGQRNAYLLALREQMLGSRLTGVVVCPHCGEQLELDLSMADLRPTSAGEPAEIFTADTDRYHVQFRLPNSLDLVAIRNSATVEAARQRLLSRLALRIERDGEEISLEHLPENVVATLAERLSQADPQADTRLALDCPACRHEWLAALDIAAFLWSELHAWASRILRDVHLLAATYGWREADILALSTARREFYLEMVRG
ncbi:MAG TPA: phage baseplate protein [Anaerolineae bacterium]|nr:phage baseplate protein [Anaerolineae bacterium]